MLVCIDNLHNMMNDESQKIVRIFMEDPSYFDLMHVVSYYNFLCNSLIFTAWNVFTLNKSLIIGFIGALVSFTALFTQIASSFKGNSQFCSSKINNNTEVMSD
jgi:hypothetical protein